MGVEVIPLAAHEAAVVDTRRLVVLRQSLGPKRCREVVEEVVFHLTERLTLLEKALEAGDTVEGFRLAARLARDLCACLDAGEPNAIAAVAARLVRLGEDSLFSVISYADQSAL
jgi:hypothetical protein